MCIIQFMPNKPKTTGGTPANIVQMRAPLAYVLAFRAAAQKRGMTPAQAGMEALKDWLNKVKAPIPPIHPGGSPSDKI